MFLVTLTAEGRTSYVIRAWVIPFRRPFIPPCGAGVSPANRVKVAIGEIKLRRPKLSAVGHAPGKYAMSKGVALANRPWRGFVPDRLGQKPVWRGIFVGTAARIYFVGESLPRPGNAAGLQRYQNCCVQALDQSTRMYSPSMGSYAD